MSHVLNFLRKRPLAKKTPQARSRARRLRPVLEGLEDRTLLSITFSGPHNSGLCTLTGSSPQNEFEIQLKPGDPSTIEFIQNGVGLAPATIVDAALSGITGVDMIAAPGNANLTLNENNGLIGQGISLPINFNGAAGLDTLIVQGNAGAGVTETLTEGMGRGVSTLVIANATLSSTISLSSVGRIKDTMTADTLIVNTSAGAISNFVHLHNGPTINNFKTDTVDLRNLPTLSANLDDQDVGAFSPASTSTDDSPDAPTFGTLDSLSFADKTNLVLNGDGSSNFFLVNVNVAADGLHSLTLDGVHGVNVAAIRALPPNVTLHMINIQVEANSSSAAFIEEMYEERLGRLASQSELSSWMKVLEASGQQAVAVGIEDSLEARTNLVKNLYLHYLGRAAVNGEEQGWVRLLMNGETEEQVIAGLLSSSEFYARAQTMVSSGTPDQRFVQALYLVVLNRSATSAEVSFWVGRLPTLGRFGVALGFLESAEFRDAVITAYYVELLQRPPDSLGLAAWQGSGKGLGQIRLNFEESAEFFANG